MTDIRVDQAFFGWSQEQQRLTMLASSFSGNDAPKYWLHQLQAHIRLQPMPDTVLPVDAFSYFRFGQHAVVLRRVGVGASAGRNNSHALIASAELLTPSVAIGLPYWKGWQQQPPGSSFMSSLSFESLDGAPRAAEKHRKELVRCEGPIAAVLARFLEDPRRPLSVVGCHDPDRLAVVWALRELAERYVQPAPQPMPDWSFSTYEDRHDVTVEDLPWIVFLPARTQTGTVERTVIDLKRPDVLPEHLAHLRPLVRDLANDVPPRSSPPQPDYGDTVAEPSNGGKATAPGPVKPVPAAARDAVAILHESRNLSDFVRRLNQLERNSSPENRPALRAALDVRAMDLAARFVEVEGRRELLERLLMVAYGPGLDDLDDATAEKHAARLLRETRSDQLAMMIGTEDRMQRDRIREAILRRWTAGRSEPSEAGARMLRRFRAARLGRLLPWIAVAGVLAVLGMVFLGGYLAGRPAGMGRDAASPATTAGPGPSPAAELPPSVGTAILGAAPDQLVFSFLKVAGGYLPQAPCTNDGASVWRCPKPSRPGREGDQASLVAVPVPQDQVADLVGKAQRGEGVQRDGRWGAESPIR